MTTDTTTLAQPRPGARLDRPILRALPGGGSEQLCLPYEYEVSPGVPAVPTVPRHLRVSTTALMPKIDPALPDPGRWAGRMAQAAAEVAIGARPPGQLTGHFQRDELARLARRGQLVARHPSARAQRGVARLRAVRRVHVCPVADGIVECSVVLVSGERAQAVALRLEAADGRWLVTAIQLG